MIMRNILTSILLISTMLCFGQAAYVQPSPTGKADSVSLFINIAAAPDGEMNSGLNARLDAHPDEDIYIWTWQPAGPVAGNGDWENSNEAMKMTKVGDKLYMIKFLPTSFYGVDATTFFTNGISCLAKMDNGKAYLDDFPGEAKTKDLKITIVPKLCDQLYCPFPELARKSDFFSITYDNELETDAAMLNVNNEDCYLVIYGGKNNNTMQPYVEPTEVFNHPELKLKPVSGNPNSYRITVLPEELFSQAIQNGTITELNRIKYYVVRQGLVYTTPPPIQTYIFENCN